MNIKLHNLFCIDTGGITYRDTDLNTILCIDVEYRFFWADFPIIHCGIRKAITEWIHRGNALGIKVAIAT